MQMDGKLNLKEEQEVLMNVSDMLNDVLTAESLLLRVEKLTGIPENIIQRGLYDAMLKVFLSDATACILKNGTDALASLPKATCCVSCLWYFEAFHQISAGECETRTPEDCRCADRCERVLF